MTIIRAETPAELAIVADMLHDAWFDAERIRFDHSSHDVEIPFERQVIEPVESGQRTGLLNTVLRRSILCFLKIRNVLEFSIHDTEKVRYYDLSSLTFHRNYLKIETGVPIQLTIKVDRLCVEFEQTDRVLEEQEGRRISFDFFSRPSKAFASRAD